MILSSTISQSTVPIDESHQKTTTLTVDEQRETVARPLHRKNHRSTPTFLALTENPSKNDVEFRAPRAPMTVRQRAEIQLQGLLTDPEMSLPAFTRRVTEDLPDDQISLEQVSKLLNTQSFIIERIVRAIYPSKKNDEAIKTLSRIEVQKLTRILNGTMDVRTLIFFLMLNLDDDQYITYDELSQFYGQYLKGLKTFDANRMEEFIQVLSKKFHLDQKPQIDFDEFYSIVSKDGTLLESISQFTVNPTWFVNETTNQRPQNQLQEFLSKLCWQQSMYEQQKNKLTIDYIKDNLSRIVFLILYVLVNLALLLYVIIYRSVVTKSHVLVVFARCGGMLLNFNCALVFALMLKRTILLIRKNKFLRKIIPVDDHIDFHKFVGRFIAVLSIIHTIAHMSNFGRLDDYSWAEYMFTTKPNIGWVGGFAPLSGVILCVILAVMVICSMQWIRRGGHFQVFYWTHLLYYAFFILLILHAPNYWKWAIGPLVILLLEKIYSFLRRLSSRSGRTYLTSATIEQSNVISLKMHRPKNFSFKPGDYITINLPRVALYEFHPFTISSAPEETNYISVHIQAVGNWTKRVYQRFKEMSESETNDGHVRVFRADLNQRRSNLSSGEDDQDNIPQHLESDSDCGSTISRSTTSTRIRSKSEKREPVVINGPYSSCARYIFDCKHVVLIGGGIGVTPYASILSSLMAQFRSSRTVCKHCNGINYQTKNLGGNRRLRKVDFIWVNRDQKNFEWFLNLLRQFEQEQEFYLACNPSEQRFLDIHLYFTEIKHDENIGNAPLDLVTRVWAEVAGEDIFTSLKSKTHIGRPNWNDLFNRLVSGENASIAHDVNVFFCGPATMGQTIREHCSTYRFRYYEENF